MAILLIVHHTPSPNMQAMFEAVVSGATTEEIEGVDVVRRPALAATAADVLATWQSVLGDAALTVSREQAVDEGWFGPLAPGFARRLGDVVAVALGTAGVIRSAAEPSISRMVGQHGGLTSAEQLVPLLVARA